MYIVLIYQQKSLMKKNNNSKKYRLTTDNSTLQVKTSFRGKRNVLRTDSYNS